MIWVLFFLFLLSCASSLAFFVYIKKLVEIDDDREKDLEEILEMINGYHKELANVFQMQIYYGDTTLQSLLKNTMVVKKTLEEFLEIYEDESND